MDVSHALWHRKKTDVGQAVGPENTYKMTTVVGAMIVCLLGLSVYAEETTNRTAGLEATSAAQVTGPLGADTHPVRCDMPDGERAYLQRLRGADGKVPAFFRIGSFAPGPYGNILDGYKVKSGTNAVMVFMDMYHPGFVETNAVPGFTIINREAGAGGIP
jgi:hypothetical protein